MWRASVLASSLIFAVFCLAQGTNASLPRHREPVRRSFRNFLGAYLPDERDPPTFASEIASQQNSGAEAPLVGFCLNCRAR